MPVYAHARVYAPDAGSNRPVGYLTELAGLASSTAVEYSNALARRRRTVAVIAERPPRMTAYDRSGASSHRGDHGRQFFVWAGLI